MSSLLKTGRFSLYVVPLLLVLFFGGGLFAGAGDYSDGHKVHTVHLDKAIPSDADLEECRNKMLPVPVAVNGFQPFLPPAASLSSILTRASLHRLLALQFISRSLPSRASPV